MTVSASDLPENNTATLAKYVDIPIIDAFVTCVENNTNYENSIKAMLNGILAHYFPIDMGYAVAPKQNRDNKLSHFLVCRLRCRFSEDRGIVDHALIKAKGRLDTLEESVEQLTEALENSNTDNGQCWAILAIDAHLIFYEYFKDLPKNESLLPWCPPGQPTNSFHIRHDYEVIDWMFNYMRQKDGPQAR
ncbi:uncharacterized protein PGRI_008590 [Penicillium griseofulvum]|uniref:Uncharacterized protein n=1 Tax=Penicillium patulum TaxID=5078 RepID=A0A135LXW4_PENPA|nr:uncharacterized protein PGRI_008590 [Penicillium griseofulvum]KXG53809.1 hypothetical protein PGRI_008590 [Penicillium griseofulvum]